MPVAPTVHYNMGGIPTNYHGEVVTLKDGDPDSVVPGLFAVGEAACVSVHGANRLGSNSLIDLVVFGRAAGLRLGRDDQARTRSQEPLPKDAGDLALARLDHFRNAKGEQPDRRGPRGDAAHDAGRLRGVPHRARRWPRASPRSTRSSSGWPTSASPTAA